MKIIREMFVLIVKTNISIVWLCDDLQKQIKLCRGQLLKYIKVVFVVKIKDVCADASIS